LPPFHHLTILFIFRASQTPPKCRGCSDFALSQMGTPHFDPPRSFQPYFWPLQPGVWGALKLRFCKKPPLSGLNVIKQPPMCHQAAPQPSQRLFLALKFRAWWGGMAPWEMLGIYDWRLLLVQNSCNCSPSRKLQILIE
jgi:hypothetical protein